MTRFACGAPAPALLHGEPADPSQSVSPAHPSCEAPLRIVLHRVRLRCCQDRAVPGGDVRPTLRSVLGGIVVCAFVVASMGMTTSDASGDGRPAGDVARYILPPGNYGGLPTTANSRDQLPLYDALTPLRGNVTDADIQQDYLPENFAPIGPTTEITTGRPGLTLLSDEYGIAHVYGKPRAD